MPNPRNSTLDPAALRRDLDELHRETGRSTTMTDELLDDIVFRLTALEEILAAPWWRRGWVRRRLARAIRASVAEIDGPDFTAKRLNSIATGWRDIIAPWDTRRREGRAA